MSIPRTVGWLLLGLAVPLTAQANEAAKPDPKTRLQELQLEYRQALTDWRKQMADLAEQAKAKAAKGEAVPAMPMRPPVAGIVAKYLAAAKDCGKTDDAVDFLVPVLSMTEDRAEAARVLDTLLADHLGSTKLRGLGRMMPALAYMVDADVATKALGKLEADAGDPAVRGWAKLARLEPVLRAEPITSETYRAGRAQLVEAQKAGDHMLTVQIETLFTDLEKFAIGMLAPDIAGVDLDGVAFKLSDYKGKVIFVDFWGDW